MMRTRTQLALNLLHVLLVLPVLANAQQQAPVTLDRLVSLERQKVLGLDKLTPEQRAGVVLLLQEAYQVGLQNAQQQATSAAANKSNGATPAVIETKVDGEFNGWEGETILKLMNGQIWQQTEYYYHYHYAFMPKVIIYKSNGSYKMKVEGVDKAIGVGRLR